MRDGLLSIGEVARMKGVGVKALRYWEEAGALMPAFVDPHTRYRYYSIGQLPLVDAIMLCLDLGIPLKSIGRHIGADGQLDADALFDRGRTIALAALRRARASLMKAEAYQAYVGGLSAPGGSAGAGRLRKTGPYLLIGLAWDGPFDARRYVGAQTRLLRAARQRGLVPLVLQGFARIPRTGRGPAWQTVLEVGRLDNGEEEAGEAAEAEAGGAAMPESAEAEAGPALIAVDEGVFRTHPLETPDLPSCFESVFALAARTCPAHQTVLAFERWSLDADGGRFRIDMLQESGTC